MYPADFLIKNDVEFDMFWFNPNIHPKFEYERRLANLKIVSEHYCKKLIVDDLFSQELWDNRLFDEKGITRCEMCYDIRLDEIAKFASENGYDSFSTTLLVSPYQQHELICETAQKKAQIYGVKFEYYDFRPGFREGQNMAREIGLYRQKYCGCIMSLEESKFRDKIYKSFESI